MEETTLDQALAKTQELGEALKTQQAQTADLINSLQLYADYLAKLIKEVRDGA